MPSSRQTLAKQAQVEIAKSRGVVRDQLPGPWKDMASSRMQRARYDSSQREIHVIFRDGTPWIYSDVPPNIWRNLRRSASPGRFVNRVLNAFPYYQAPASFEELDAALVGAEEPLDADQDAYLYGVPLEQLGRPSDVYDDVLR